MTNVLIVLTLPQAVRMQYFDHVKKHFPEVRLDMVDHKLVLRQFPDRRLGRGGKAAQVSAEDRRAGVARKS
jgi:hypothetical protein